MHGCCGQLYIKNIKNGSGPSHFQSRGPIDPLEFWLDLNAANISLRLYFRRFSETNTSDLLENLPRY